MKKINFRNISTLILIVSSFFAISFTANAENIETGLIHSKYKECINGNTDSCKVAEDIRAVRHAQLIYELDVLVKVKGGLFNRTGYTPKPFCWLPDCILPPICKLIDCGKPPIPFPCDPRLCGNPIAPLDYFDLDINLKQPASFREATINIIDDLELDIEAMDKFEMGTIKMK